MVPGSAGAEPPPGWYLRDRDSGALYKRGRLLGEGTFGRCYQVTEVTSGRLYAAKAIPRARLAAAGVGDRVERERELQCHLRHPHIVRLHGHFADRGHLYLLLELCGRGSLADILRARDRLTEPEVRYYLRQLLSGLRYLHGHGLVHRDLKPSNFLVTERMRVKIGDLGLAQPAAPPGRRWGALCGTPSYLAPEVLDRRGHAVPSDIWALGCAVLSPQVRGAERPRPVRGSPPAGAVPADPGRSVPAAPPALAPCPRPHRSHAAPRARGTAQPGGGAGTPLPQPGFHTPHAAPPRLSLRAHLPGTGPPAPAAAGAALLAGVWLCPCHPRGWPRPSPKHPSLNIRGGKKKKKSLLVSSKIQSWKQAGWGVTSTNGTHTPVCP
ncbi:inactive serine/threonine-protein kinase PLK5-like isoform X1 [Oenanthe melanoleuca]|uniref:inactive serine/threonine-protein kinase PLK5-like isoform X1 n=1 Tax=Oenanthe melanoleuca TaxID=2939378 RepID=UPI0024C14226|nr:inactive serine/threonine-protein kinase PLK5-like isoform X1 [Oenanthe melanoleuca]